MLEHLGHVYDSADERCPTIALDGDPADPDGVDGYDAMRLAYAETMETKRLPDGREALCRIGNTGAAGCAFTPDHFWLHLLQKAEGSITRLPNDVLGYRLHYGEIDAWLWQDHSMGSSYNHIGITFKDACASSQ